MHGVTALGEPARVGGIPHQRKGSRGHVWALSISVGTATFTSTDGGPGGPVSYGH
jgi:hypothetical protein